MSKSITSKVESYARLKALIGQDTIVRVRKLLSYLVETGALPYNPAREVTTEKVRRVSGKTPALS